MPNPYDVKIAPLAHRQIVRLAPKYQKHILRFVETLGINPRPPGAAKIDGMTGLYYQEVTPLRIIYKIEEQEVFVLVVK